MNIQMCELCDNFTDFDYCEACGEDVCQICQNAYGCDFQSLPNRYQKRLDRHKDVCLDSNRQKRKKR